MPEGLVDFYLGCISPSAICLFPGGVNSLLALRSLFVMYTPEVGHMSIVLFQNQGIRLAPLLRSLGLGTGNMARAQGRGKWKLMILNFPPTRHCTGHFFVHIVIHSSQWFSQVGSWVILTLHFAHRVRPVHLNNLLQWTHSCCTKIWPQVCFWFFYFFSSLFYKNDYSAKSHRRHFNF